MVEQGGEEAATAVEEATDGKVRIYDPDKVGESIWEFWLKVIFQKDKIVDEVAEQSEEGGTITARILKKIIERLGNSFRSSMEKYGEAKLFEAEGHKQQVEAIEEFWAVYGEEITELGSDLALLYLVWVMPIFPPHVKGMATVATIEKALTLTAFSAPLLVPYINAFAKEFGLEFMNEEELERQLEGIKTFQSYLPRFILKSIALKGSDLFGRWAAGKFDPFLSGHESIPDLDTPDPERVYGVKFTSIHNALLTYMEAPLPKTRRAAKRYLRTRGVDNPDQYITKGTGRKDGGLVVANQPAAMRGGGLVALPRPMPRPMRHGGLVSI